MKINGFKYLLLFPFFLIACNSKIDTKDVLKFKQKYSADAINYFFEVAFHKENENGQLIENTKSKTRQIEKWNNDIHFFVQGDTISGDRKIFFDAIAQLNALKLTVKFIETFQADKANLLIRFGTPKQLDLPKNVGGCGIYTSKKGYIYEALIKIPFNGESVQKDYLGRAKIILEEITQILGLPSDSYSYPNSVFYQDNSYSPLLEDIDKQLLHFLYEPSLPVGYSCNQFENDFKEILYHVNEKDKFLALVKKHKIDKKIIQDIYKFGLTKEKIIKFSYPTNVALTGDYDADDLNVIKEIIGEINDANKKLHLILVKNDTLLPEGGIHIKLEKKQHQLILVDAKITTFTMQSFTLRTRVESNIEVFFKDSINNRNTIRPSVLIEFAIANALYNSVCLADNSQREPFFYVDNKKILLKPYYHYLLEIFYNDSIPRGFTKEALADVLKQF